MLPKPAFLLAAIGFSLLLNVSNSSAQSLSHEEMVCALNPECTNPFVNRRLRGVTAAPVARPSLSFDETLNFAYDSAELTADSRSKLDGIARALKDTRINQYDIAISGHTCARGTAEYNQGLSERRAEAARRYLIAEHGIDPNRLVAKGYGKSQLLLPSEPNNDLNRRVQFQNSSYATAAGSSTPKSGASKKVAGPTGMPAADGDGM
jgi:outer membrane protein OmpA-like peptidoglycan-associated protein